MTAPASTILLADDEPSLVVGLSVTLRRAGYTVVVASNGADAIRLAREHHPNLILCDVMMPPPNGFEVRRALAEEPGTAEIPFMFLTARTNPADELFGLQSGADDYITKPFDRDVLLARISATLRRERLGWRHGHHEAETEWQQLQTEISQNMRHELRTPLSVVLQSLQLAIGSKFGDDPEERRWFINQALTSTRQLQRLIETMIFMSDLDQPDHAFVQLPIDPHFDIQVPVHDCVRGWKREADLTVTIAPGLEIIAPPVGLVAAITYLVDNACKFSAPGTPIAVKVDSRPPGLYQVVVADRGPGIPPECRERVFERYCQLSQGVGRQFGGLGLGLALARAFARRMGGDVIIGDAAPGCEVQMTLSSHPMVVKP